MSDRREEPQSSPTVGPESEPAPVVLAVEADPDMSVLCGMYLSGAGFEVLEAASGSDALTLARTRLPAVIVLDCMLPDMDGTKVLQALKAEDATAAIPVVMATTQLDVRDQEAAWELDVFDFVTRPFDKDRLLEVVGAALVPSKREEAERRCHAALQRLRERDFEAWQRLAAIEASTEDAIIGSTTLDGTITSWNTAAERLYGYRAEEVIGRPITVLVPPDRVDENLDILRRVARGERIEHFKTVRQHHDGHLVDISLSITPIRDRSGTVTGASAIVRDLTARRRSNAREQAMAETVSDAMVIVDDDGIIELVNHHTEALFGYDRGELVGQPVEMLIPDWLRVQHRQFREAYLAAPMARPMGTELDLHGLRKDGTMFSAEISLNPLQGERLSVAATIRDVTERERTEAAFRGLLESAPDAMVVVDVDGRIQLLNARAEQVFGYARGELVGQAVEVLVPPRFRAHNAQNRDAYSADLLIRPWEGVLYGLRKDGTEFPIEISLSPLATSQGLLISVAIRDITERTAVENARVVALGREREASERLRELDQLRSDFLSTVSHELRTPLGAIKGFAEILETEWTEVPEAKKVDILRRIAGASRRLDSLMGELLDFARLERGQLAINVEPQPLAELVANVLERAAPVLETHPVDVAVPEDLSVMADPIAFSRALENLLSNAAKFSPPGSGITLSAHPDPTGIAVSVADHGPGIPPDEVDKIFDRFYRIGGPDHRSPGTGIGLAIVKQSIEAQGGHVEVTSTEGAGSTFTIHLPASP